MGIQAATFDVDGTLYDGKRCKRRYVLQNLFQMRLVRVALAVREDLRGQDFESGADLRDAELDEIARRLSIPRPDVSARISHLLGERLSAVLEQIGPRPEARQLLVRLLDQGIKIGVVSDYPPEDKLRALGLSDLPWSTMIGADALGALKPSGRAFLEAAQELDIAPAHILHIGDRPDTDGVGAENAGVQARILSLGKFGLPRLERPLEAALSDVFS
jgi:FMN phosphatase YigB (HAD superfamily)